MKTVSQDMQGTVEQLKEWFKISVLLFIQQSLHYLLVIHQIQVNS